MNILGIKKKCIGCGACVAVCSCSALSLGQNEDGFYRPMMDKLKCIDCGKCVKICPIINKSSFEPEQRFYYGWCNDESVRAESSSGGAFTVLADSILASGGVVFGAKYSNDFSRVVMASTDEATMDELRVSKYCSADSSGLYEKMTSALKKGKKILLTGTPCQIAAARRIFGQDNANLILVDFLCGGNPSARCYEDYIHFLERKYKSKVSSVNFRDKGQGWSKMVLTVHFENGKKYSSYWEYDPYYVGFCGTFTRDEQCLDCIFSERHESDITIADFWGYRKANITNDEKGMSLITIHSQRGQKLFEEAKHRMTIFKLDEKYGSYGFVQKHADPQKVLVRKQFFEEFKKNGFVSAARSTYFKGGKIAVVARKISSRLLGK